MEEGGAEYMTNSACSEEESMILEESFDCFGEIVTTLKKDMLMQQEQFNQRQHELSTGKAATQQKGKNQQVKPKAKASGSDILLQGQLNNSNIIKKQNMQLPSTSDKNSRVKTSYGGVSTSECGALSQSSSSA